MDVKRLLVICAVLCLLAIGASADVDFGAYARSVGMGGAGLALINEPTAATTMNPAALGLLNKKVNFIFPSFTVRSEGASVSDVIDNLNNVYNMSSDDAQKLARDFGSGDTSLNADMITGFTVGSIGVTIDGQADARIIPSEQFKQWAQNNVLPSDSNQFYADVKGQAVVSLPSVAFAAKVPSLKPEKGDLWVGTKLKLLRGYAHTERVELASDYISGDPNVRLQTRSIVDTEETGLGADLGLIYKPAGNGNMTYAFAVTNALKSSLGPIDLGTVVNAGVAGQPLRGLTWAADLVNITGAYDQHMQLRAGAEYRLGRILALRGGYSSRAWTFGFGVAGYDFAFSGKSPFTVGRTILF